jgi:tartrate-resistant acid phosphatase type 5
MKKRVSISALVFLALLSVTCNTSKNLSAGKSKETHFFVFGDWGRKGIKDQQEVADQMKIQAKKLAPSFFLVTGDNFYDDGVKSIYDTQWKESYTNVYKELSTNYPWYVSLGNHDYRINPQAEIDYHAVNEKWNMPDRYYTTVLTTRDGQKIRLVCIDTSPWYTEYYNNPIMTGVKTQDTAAQRRWIDSTLAAATEPWKIVFGHHPVLSAAKRGGTPELINMLKPLLEKYHVQAYICGHDHNLQHNRPQNSYVDYFVSGGGSEVKDNASFTPAAFAESKLGFADFSIRGDSLWMRFIDKDGKIIYRYARSR